MYFAEVKCILLNVYGLAQFHNRFRKDMILSDFSGIPDSVRIRLNGSGRERGATAGASSASVGVFSIGSSCRISSSVCTYSSMISPLLGTRFKVSSI